MSIIIKTDGGGESRSQMRESMRRMYRNHEGVGSYEEGGGYEEGLRAGRVRGYREGYKDGREDGEYGEDGEYDEWHRRGRDSRGRYM
jgi:hypothetical protein